MSDFESAFAAAREVEGWLTEAQARVLYERAAAVAPGGCVVEIGSFRGRSTIVLAAMRTPGAPLIAIDPHAGGDRGPQEIAADAGRGEADHQAFRANVETAGIDENVRHVRAYSSDAHDAVDREIDLLYVDGAHRFGPARSDLVRWGARVREGGAMLVHDSFSSIGVTVATLSAITFGSRWRYVGRTGSLAEYRRERVRGTARFTNAVRQLAQLPWFAWNVVLKVLIALRFLRRPWPY